MRLLDCKHLSFADGLPFVEECDYIFRAESSARFKFALFLAENERSVGVQNGEARNSLRERDLIFLRQVQILVVLAHVNVHDVEVRLDQGSNTFRMKSLVQDVAVIAPVSAEYEQDALVITGCSLDCRLYFRWCLFRRRLKIGVGFCRLGQSPSWVRN